MKHHMIRTILAHTPSGSIYHQMALYALPVDVIESIYMEVMA